ncbi:hypothetical protein [Parvicella tangerina]|nr:hypothetical protein [Parvicella tangerina]
MTNDSKKTLGTFNRNSYITLFLYLIAVSLTIFFSLNQYDQIVSTSIKLVSYALYLGFMMWSLINLKNYLEATRDNDYSMDILVYAMVGIPLYIFAFFYIRGKLKNDLTDH